MKDFRTPKQRLNKPSKKRDSEGVWSAICIVYAILLTVLFVEFLKSVIF